MWRSVVLILVLGALAGCTDGEESAEEFCRRLTEPLPGNRWVDVDFMVHVDPEADDRDVEAIRDALADADEVDGYTWVDQDEAYAEFLELFGDRPEMIDAASPEILPPRAEVRLTEGDPEAVRRIGEWFEGRKDVYRVVFASEVPRSVIEGSVRPLTSGFAANSSAFTSGRSDVRLVEVAPSSLREHADVLEGFWASPGTVGDGEADPIVEAARQVAAFYDTECA